MQIPPNVRELGIAPTTIISSNGANPIIVNIVINFVNPLKEDSDIIRYFSLETWTWCNQLFKHVDTQAQCFLR